MERASGARMAKAKLGLFTRLHHKTTKCASDQAKHRDELCNPTYRTSKSKERARLEMACNRRLQ